MNTVNPVILLSLGLGLGACTTATRTTQPVLLTNNAPDLVGDLGAGPILEVPATAAISTPLSVSPASTQQRTPPNRGRAMPWEFAIGGAGISNDRVDAGAGQLATSVGYYFNEVVEVSVRQSGLYSDAGRASRSSWDGATRGAIDFHVPFGRFVPYFGASVGYAYGDTIRDTWVGGPEAGAKFYLQNDAFLQAGVEWQFFFDENDTLNSAFDDGQLLYGISIGLRF